ncbi:hypothetical protein K438DRAFT_1784172 [Mycena galopus ATCC 62051]|nr:hypothetical protein K438DRAFT_1784172 [Mycena galopus ATCC 62051]
MKNIAPCAGELLLLDVKHEVYVLIIINVQSTKFAGSALAMSVRTFGVFARGEVDLRELHFRTSIFGGSGASREIDTHQRLRMVLDLEKNAFFSVALNVYRVDIPLLETIPHEGQAASSFGSLRSLTRDTSRSTSLSPVDFRTSIFGGVSHEIDTHQRLRMQCLQDQKQLHVYDRWSLASNAASKSGPMFPDSKASRHVPVCKKLILLWRDYHQEVGEARISSTSGKHPSHKRVEEKFPGATRPIEAQSAQE